MICNCFQVLRSLIYLSKNQVYFINLLFYKYLYFLQLLLRSMQSTNSKYFHIQRKRVKLSLRFSKQQTSLNQALQTQNYKQFQKITKQLKSQQQIQFFCCYLFEEDILKVSNIQKILLSKNPQKFFVIVTNFLNQNLIEKTAITIRIQQYLQNKLNQQKCQNKGQIDEKDETKYLRKHYLNINRQILKALTKNQWQYKSIRILIDLLSIQFIFVKMFKTNFDLEQLKTIVPLFPNSKIQLKKFNECLQTFYLPFSRALKYQKMSLQCQKSILQFHRQLCWNKETRQNYLCDNMIKNEQLEQILVLDQIGYNIVHELAIRSQINLIKILLERQNTKIISLFNSFSSSGQNFLDICLKRYQIFKLKEVLNICKNKKVYFSSKSLHNILANSKLSKIQKQQLFRQILVLDKVSYKVQISKTLTKNKKNFAYLKLTQKKNFNFIFKTLKITQLKIRITQNKFPQFLIQRSTKRIVLQKLLV